MFKMANETVIKWPKLILFGDSLTQRCFDPNDGLWGALLADRLQRTCDVLSRGFSGYTTRKCLSILPSLFSTENVSDISAFTIFLGANDSCNVGTPQHVPLDEYEKNLESMIKYLVHIGLCKKKIVLITCPPYCDGKYTEFCKEMGRVKHLRNAETIAKYAEGCCKVAQKCEVDAVNLHQEMLKDENWPNYLLDGLHLSSSGAKFLYNLLWPYIEARVDVSKLIMPLWNDPVWD